MDPHQLRELRAAQRKQDATLTRRAKESPLPSTGGRGGFQPGTSATPVLRPTAHTERLTAEDLGGAVDTGGPAKSYGMEYLGHMANDDVMEKGHNVGHKPKGMATNTTIARKGYRTIPGTGANQIGVAKGEAPTGLQPSRAEREKQAAEMKAFEMEMKRLPKVKPFVQPVKIMGGMSAPQPRGVSDIKLSMKHHKESIANDKKHISEHKASIKNHTKLMKTRGKQLGKKK